MQRLSKILCPCYMRALVITLSLLLFYTNSSFAAPTGPTGSCTSYTSACPSEAKVFASPPGCTPDGYPAFNGPADPGSIDGAPCPGPVWSSQGTNTYASAAAAGNNAFETDQADGHSGYECFELAVRYWKFRFGFDINKFCLSQGDCMAQGLQYLKWPSNVAVVEPTDGSYTPVCGDLVSYNNAYQHVNLVTKVTCNNQPCNPSTPNPNAQVTTLNQNTGGWDPWATGPVTNPIGGGTSGFHYIHNVNNKATGSACPDNMVSTSCPPTLEPFAGYAFNSGIGLVVDDRRDLNAFILQGGTGLFQNNDNAAGNGWSSNWNQMPDNNAAHDPVAVLEPDGNGGRVMDVFYWGEDGNIWHDYQTGWTNGNQNTPTWNGPVDLIQQWNWVSACQGQHCPPGGEWVPTQLILPSGVLANSNLAVGIDSGNIIHLIFMGVDSSNPKASVVNIYDIAQATPHDEFDKPPRQNVWDKPKVIAKGSPIPTATTSAVGIILPAGSTQSVPIGHPTVIRDKGGVLHVFYESNDVMQPNYDRGFIFHIYQKGNSWSTPQRLGYAASGSANTGTIYPVVDNSNIGAIVNPDGRLEIFYRGANETFWHMWQTSAGVNASWAAPLQLGENMTSDAVAALNENGQLQVFYRDSGGDIRSFWRYNLGGNNGLAGNWSCRTNLIQSGMTQFPNGVRPPSIANSVPAVGMGNGMGSNAGWGRLQLLYIGTNNDIWHIGQKHLNTNRKCEDTKQPIDNRWCGGDVNFCQPYPYDIGGQASEAQVCYGSSSNTTITACQGLDDFIQQFEGFVPYCYGDSNDLPWGQGGGGTETFGIGTVSLLPQSAKLCNLPSNEKSACDICTPTKGGADAYAGTGIGCASAAQGTAAKTCADTLLNDFLQPEIQTIFGGPGGKPPGEVNPAQAAKLNACQQAALIDYSYQYGYGPPPSPCIAPIINAINAGAFNTAGAMFTSVCPTYLSRRQAEQKLWNENPCHLTACTP